MLKRIVDVRDDEVTALLVSFFHFFALMAGYFILKPIRDELGVQIGARNLPWLFTATLVSMLVLVPIYSALVARYERRKVLPLLYRFFLVNLLAFYVLWTYHIAPPGSTERVFYVWLSVYNVFTVSVMWSFMADIWTTAQGKRMFGFIAAGGSLGSIIGSSSVIALIKPIGSTALLLISAALLEAAAHMVKYLSRHANPQAGAARPVGGGLFDSFWHAVRSPFLFGIVAQTLLFTITSTFIYILQTNVMKDYGSREVTTQFYSTQDLIINACSAFIQAGLTARFVRRLGVTGGLAITPVITVLGFALLWFWPTVWTVAGVMIVRRVFHYGFDRPSKEMLFTTVDRDDRYKTKNLIDTAVYRTGDQVGIWTQPVLGGLLAPVGIPIAIVWLVVGIALGRGFDARTHAREGATS